jgi:zinc D-Ala-D-Ala carboxypeptidase
MSKLSFIVSVFLLLFAFVYINDTGVKSFVQTQIATIIGIHPKVVYSYQKNKGLHRTLKVGDSGKDVLLVQQALHKLRNDFLIENVTGFYGEETKKAIASYQSENNLPVSGTINKDTREKLNEVYFKELCPDPQENIYRDELLIKVNRDKALSPGFIPSGLVKISDQVKTLGVVCVKSELVSPLVTLMQNASKDNITLAISSGFRRPEIQNIVYKIWTSVQGAQRAKESVALPLHSEHQTGAAVDFTGKSNAFIGADDFFADTIEDVWLQNNAYKYGFVLSYPKDKASITGYTYEPWHYRYVGVERAREIYDRKISVEEYLTK